MQLRASHHEQVAPFHGKAAALDFVNYFAGLQIQDLEIVVAVGPDTAFAVELQEADVDLETPHRTATSGPSAR